MLRRTVAGRPPHPGSRTRPVRTRLRWTALAATAALLAAGGAADEEETFVPGDGPAPGATATGDAAPKASAGPSTPAGSGPRVERVRSAPGMEVVVEWPGGLSAEHAAMVRAYRDYVTKIWGAIATSGKDRSYLETLEEPARFHGYAWVRAYAEGAMAAKGTVRLYGLRVASVQGTGAEVDACIDRSGVRVTDAATGRALADQPDWTRPGQAVHFQAAGVRRGEDGVWRVTVLHYAEQPDERAKGCLR